MSKPIPSKPEHSGQFRVFHRKTRKYQTPPLSWEDAVRAWQDCDNCIILEAR